MTKQPFSRLNVKIYIEGGGAGPKGKPGDLQLTIKMLEMLHAKAKAADEAIAKAEEEQKQRKADAARKAKERARTGPAATGQPKLCSTQNGCLPKQITKARPVSTWFGHRQKNRAQGNFHVLENDRSAWWGHRDSAERHEKSDDTMCLRRPNLEFVRAVCKLIVVRSPHRASRWMEVACRAFELIKSALGWRLLRCILVLE
jgi:hypothetical protein